MLQSLENLGSQSHSEVLYLANSKDILRHLVDLNLEAFYPALSLNDDKEFQEFVEASKNKMELRSLDDPNYKMKMELDKDD